VVEGRVPEHDLEVPSPSRSAAEADQLPAGCGAGEQQVAHVVEQLVAGEDLDVAVVVERRPARSPPEYDLPASRSRSSTSASAVVLERDERVAVGRRHDLRQAVAVDVAERRGPAELHELGRSEECRRRSAPSST
jgi:hypothetical protein